jgi:hypothetical protein
MVQQTRPQRKWWLYILLALFLCLCVLIALGIGYIVNFGPEAPPPAESTSLPTFAAPENTTTTAPTVEPTVTELPEPQSVSSLPNPDDYTWQVVNSSFNQPVDLKHAGDGSGRLFVVERAGVIWILLNGEKSGTPFLDIRDRVGSGSSEQACWGWHFIQIMPRTAISLLITPMPAATR